jgi:catechol 2,3-dioxygenase-like lactoylglutathione lyase family enzyme
MTHPAIHAIAPFFIVRHTPTALAFYRDQLAFKVVYQEPVEDPFFAIVSRDAAMLLLKQVAAVPQPNPTRDPDARWDAYLSVPDPDALAAEFTSRQVLFSAPLTETHEGLRGFERKDPDGYVLFFGRPSRLSG